MGTLSIDIPGNMPECRIARTRRVAKLNSLLHPRKPIRCSAWGTYGTFIEEEGQIYAPAPASVPIKLKLTLIKTAATSATKPANPRTALEKLVSRKHVVSIPWPDQSQKEREDDVYVIWRAAWQKQ